MRSGRRVLGPWHTAWSPEDRIMCGRVNGCTCSLTSLITRNRNATWSMEEGASTGGDMTEIKYFWRILTFEKSGSFSGHLHSSVWDSLQPGDAVVLAPNNGSSVINTRLNCECKLSRNSNLSCCSNSDCEGELGSVSSPGNKGSPLRIKWGVWHFPHRRLIVNPRTPLMGPPGTHRGS